MKKIFVVFILFIIMFSGIKKESFTLKDFFVGDYTVYTNEKINSSSLNLGFCFSTPNVTLNKKNGESMIIYNLEVATAIKKLKAKIIKTEYLENGLTCIYAYTKLIGKTVIVDERLVNLQIAIKDNKTTIGWPLIFGSY